MNNTCEALKVERATERMLCQRRHISYYYVFPITISAEEETEGQGAQVTCQVDRESKDIFFLSAVGC